jgi:hypothetical protein
MGPKVNHQLSCGSLRSFFFVFWTYTVLMKKWSIGHVCSGPSSSESTDNFPCLLYYIKKICRDKCKETEIFPTVPICTKSVILLRITLYTSHKLYKKNRANQANQNYVTDFDSDSLQFKTSTYNRARLYKVTPNNKPTT